VLLHARQNEFALTARRNEAAGDRSEATRPTRKWRIEGNVLEDRKMIANEAEGMGIREGVVRLHRRSLEQRQRQYALAITYFEIQAKAD